MSETERNPMEVNIDFKNGICGKVRRNTAYSDWDVIDVIPENAIKQGSVIMATIFVDYLDDEMYATIKLLLKDIDQYIKDNPEHGEVA